MTAPARQPRYVLPETVAIAAVGGADLLWTVYLLASGEAYEANPLMASILHAWGPGGFVLAKALLLAVPLTVAEGARHRHPAFVRGALRVALALYLGIYALGSVLHNWPGK